MNTGQWSTRFHGFELLRDDTERDGDEGRPSRSQQRREALATLDLAGQLVALSPTRLDKLDLPDDVRMEIDHVRRITAHGARKRQLAYLAKLMRRHDDSVFDAALALLGENREQQRREAAALHRLETLRQRLLDEGDTVIEELVQEHPDLDRQRLRSLVRQAHSEQKRGKTPSAAREILRFLRNL